MVAESFEKLELFINYTVNEKNRVAALEFARKFVKDRVGRALLTEFYTNFPDVSDESICRIAQVAKQSGVLLFVLSTETHHYLAAYADDSVSFLGEYLLDDIDDETLHFFGYSSMKDFQKKSRPVTELIEYTGQERLDVCPVCGVNEGEVHFLGCPIEICPWCDGQLRTCNCRFEHLKEDELTEEKQLEELQNLLETQGRIPFSLSHAPSYPGSGAGLDVDDTKE